MQKIRERARKFFEDNKWKSMIWSMHLIFGLLMLSTVMVQVGNYRLGKSIEWYKLTNLLWIGQVWFYSVSNFKLRDTLFEQRKTIMEMSGLVSTVNEINAAIVRRIKKLPPNQLHELGISIKETDK